MGFFGPIPADEVGALYQVQKRVLLMSAKGKVLEDTSGITFERRPFAGGLKFALEGWSGPVGTKSEEYSIEASFVIQLPNIVVPSKYVTVTTANHPEGIKVEIHFDGLDPPFLPPTGPEGEKPDVKSAPEVQELLAEDTSINVLFDSLFSIRQKSAVPSMGKITVRYDDTYVALHSASIDDTDIVWTFKAIKQGATQVIVVVNGGIAAYVQTKYYNVHIWLVQDH